MSLRLAPIVALLAAFIPCTQCVAADPAPLRPNGWPSNPDFFPIAVWLQNPSNAPKFKEIGINVYLALWHGPTPEQIAALEKHGMYVICQQNAVGLKLRGSRTLVGWMHNDEPDNAQAIPGGRGYGPPVPPSKIIDDYKRMKTADPSRPVLLNLGQGVAWDGWYGRGPRSKHPEDYPEYVKGCDIASFDIYPVTHNKAEIAGRLWYVGYGVQRLLNWTRGQKPVWCCIETTHIGNENALPTPSQVRSEVWLALVHGATGIIYFSHEFKPRFIEAGLLAHPEIAEAVKTTNAQIKELAPVLNSSTLPNALRVGSSEAAVPVSALCKRHQNDYFIFAVSERDAKTTATFTLQGLSGKKQVEVIGESRTLDALDGQFEDSFPGYGVHLYRITM